MKVIGAFARFWWDFVGDEWRIALSVGIVTSLGAVITARSSIDGRLIALAAGGALMISASAVILVSGRSRGASHPT